MRVTGAQHPNPHDEEEGGEEGGQNLHWCAENPGD